MVLKFHKCRNYGGIILWQACDKDFEVLGLKCLEVEERPPSRRRHGMQKGDTNLSLNAAVAGNGCMAPPWHHGLTRLTLTLGNYLIYNSGRRAAR